jgi:pimeloyl-ACP methyl ester carboxylesterase
VIPPCFVRLRDGRQLAYQDAPAATGVPVLFFHGLPSCRITRPEEAASAELGVRVISFDRPGFGQSDAKPGRSLLDIVDDVTALLDHLKLGKVLVAAPSGGGPSALALAYRAPERVRAVATIGAVAPLDEPGALAGITFERRVGFWLARHAPGVLRRMMSRRVGSDVQAFFARYTRHNPPVDQAILARAEVRDMFLASFAESLRPGIDAFAWEVQLAARPWGFRLSELRVPVTVWHGGLDNSIPPVMGERLAAAIPGAEFRFLPEESHLFFLSRWREILGNLLARA